MSGTKASNPPGHGSQKGSEKAAEVPPLPKRPTHRDHPGEKRSVPGRMC